MIVITLLLRTCYNGFSRGLLFETLSLLGTIGATALTMNYWEVGGRIAQGWVSFDPAVIALLTFWVMFVVLYVAVHLVLRRIARVVKWERLHWSIQGTGMVVGGLKGLWVAGLLLTALAGSGFEYLRQSVEEHSVFGPPLLRLAHEAMTEAANRTPGASFRGGGLIPPIKPPHKS